MVRFGIYFEGKSIKGVDGLDKNHQEMRIIKDAPRLMARATNGSPLTWVRVHMAWRSIKQEFRYGLQLDI